jgi:hypothetical protein
MRSRWIASSLLASVAAGCAGAAPSLVQDGELARGFGPGGRPWSVRKTTLRGGVEEGVEVLHVDNGALRFSVVATRGMSVHRVEGAGIRLGWDSPVEKLVHPRHVELNDHGGLGWLAGFTEWMVRCGVAFSGHPGADDGRLLTLHGRVGNLPASKVEVVVDDRIRIRGLVEERMFKFCAFELWTEVSTEPGSLSLRFEDRLVNRSGYEKEFQILYHANFGPPLLEAGARFLAPVKEIFPFDAYAAKDLGSYETYLGPTRNYGEQVYCVTPHADAEGRSAVMLHDAAGRRGMALRFDAAALPALTLWKNTDTIEDGYVTGLEPGTGFPYPRAVERAAGRVPALPPGGERRFTVEATILPDAAAVEALREEIGALQRTAPPRIRPKPPDRP